MTAQPATQVVTVQAGAITPAATAIARAAQTLVAGGLAAFPTETVYGLGADATNGAAVARLYAAKERPSFNPLIAHVPDAAAAHALAGFDPAAERLAAAFWPGPLPLVLPKRADCPRLVALTQAPRAAAPPAHADEPPIAPGGLASHYAPRAQLRLNAERVEAGEALLAFGPTPAAGAERGPG